MGYESMVERSRCPRCGNLGRVTDNLADPDEVCDHCVRRELAAVASARVLAAQAPPAEPEAPAAPEAAATEEPEPEAKPKRRRTGRATKRRKAEEDK